MPIGRRTSAIGGLGPKIKELRASLGLGQIAFAQALQVPQASIARWESGARPVPVGIVLQVADLAPPEHKQSWLDAAGLEAPKAKKQDTRIRKVPVLKDTDALGTLRASRDEEVEFEWEAPRQMLLSVPAEHVLQAIRAPDGDMDDLIKKGSIVAVDVSRRDPKLLYDRIVAFREEKTVGNSQGVGLRWLRRILGQDVLAPHDPRQQEAWKALDAKQGTTLVGEVVLWLGKPPEM